MTLALLPAPQRLAGEDGAPVAGTFFGAVSDPSFDGLRGPFARSYLERKLVEKKWQYVHVATRDMMLAFAIVDLGYLAAGFCAVFDRGARRLLVDENPVLPPMLVSVGEEPNDGLSARLSGPGVKARVERSAGRILVSAKWGRAAVELTLDARHAPPAMTAIAPLGPPGLFDFTQKLVGVLAQGEVRAGNATFQVNGELAGLDYTHGYLQRETAWRWAFASGRQGARAVALNLSEGFLAGSENVAWIDGAPVAVGPVRFTFESRSPLSPWRIRSEDSALELVFQPEGFRAQDIDLALVMSRYVQPFGSFSGHLTTAQGARVEIDRLAGVTEDHAARW